MSVIINISNVTKEFKIPLAKNSSFKSRIISGKSGYAMMTALNDISFNVNKGEFFGIVGRNGSGKSTLLKLLANIYRPTSGSIESHGTIAPFIELGVGFNPDLSGRENLYLNGVLLGMSRKEINGLYDEIVEFAELEKFMDQKLKNYSSGMQVRLAFSIAIRANSDILLIDEVLAVGDASFQKKCLNYFEEIKGTDKTVVLVSHDMNSIERYCDRVALLDKSKLVGVGDAKEMSIEYYALNANKEIKNIRKNIKGVEHSGTSEVIIKESRLISKEKANIVSTEEELKFEVDYEIKEKIEDLVIGFAIFDKKKTNLIGQNSKEFLTLKKKKGINTISFSYKDNPLQPGIYYLTLSAHNSRGDQTFDSINKAIIFEVVGEKNWGVLKIPALWQD